MTETGTQRAVRLGEKTELGITVSNRDGDAFTISAAVVTISRGSTKLRNAVAAGVSGAEVTYVETFSTANGYASDTLYTVTWRCTIVSGGVTYTEKAIYELMVRAAADV